MTTRDLVSLCCAAAVALSGCATQEPTAPFPAFGEPLAEPAEGFVVGVDCAFTCAGETAPRTMQASRPYAAEARGLREGNGLFWAGLGNDLMQWTHALCFAHAERACGEAEQVVGLEVRQMRSDEWVLSEPLDCHMEAAFVFSPYGKRVSVEDTMVTSKDPLVPPHTMFGQVLEWGSQSGPPHFRREEPTECGTVLEADLCLGDCLHDVDGYEEWSETLAGDSWAHPSRYVVCADELVAWRKTRPDIERSLFQYWCDTYFWNAMFEEARVTKQVIWTPGMCASTRATVHCEALWQEAP